MKIYTKNGDRGHTGLCNGQTVSKTDLRVEVCGSLDELNSVIGEISAAKHIPLLEKIQRDLFNIGSILAEAQIDASFDVLMLESEIDRMEEGLPELKNFILPGGTPQAARIHTARAICRRAEREMCKLAEKKTIIALIIQYLNRLSDLLFVLARYTNMEHGNKDIIYKS